MLLDPWVPACAGMTWEGKEIERGGAVPSTASERNPTPVSEREGMTRRGMHEQPPEGA